MRRSALKQYVRFFHSTKTNLDKPNVVVFGGNGFLGKHVLSAITPHVGQVTIASRNPETLGKHFQNGKIIF